MSTTTTDPARRLVNAYVLVERIASFGHRVLERRAGAWGDPEDAISYAAHLKAEMGAGWLHHLGTPERIVGVLIVDVRTKEAWVVQV